ncbi:MAG: hypothetical protein KJP02_11880 [Octadecabacter sp.]|nr:hypothetical protein [Octadecabacter sp.]
MQIKLNKPSVYQCEGVRLLPGMNEVDDAAAEKLLANPIVRMDLEAGTIETVEAPKKRGRPAKAEAEADE